MYNKELKLAIEYNGIQHYKYIPYFHRTIKNFNKQIENDKIKIKLCKEHNINLIVIPHTVKCDEVCKYIYNRVKKINIKTVNLPKNFNLGEIRNSASNTDKIKNMIETKGGKLLEGICVDNSSNIIIECDKGHIWETKVGYLKNNKGWCHTCARVRTNETSQKISSTLSTYLQTEKGKAEKAVSHQKRSQTMKKLREQARQEVTEKECARCHETKPLDDFGIKSAGVLGRQSWCKECTSEYKKAYTAKKRLETKQATVAN